MRDFVRVTDDGQFSLDGKRWFCNSAIYFGHRPGAMNNWFTPDVWPENSALLERDFAEMANIGINHAALFLGSEMFFDNGKPVQYGYDCLDTVVETGKRNDVRLTLFCGPFIDSPQNYRLITGKEWVYGDQWLPSFNPALFDAYVQQVKPLAERYRDEPMVMGYGDRIDRFYKGFDNVSIPFDLKARWADWLLARYGNFKNLMDAVGGSLEGNPRDFNEVLLPQESRYNGSLYYPLAFDFILMQKKEIGNAQANWDAEMLKIAPDQVMWTPFEGPTLDWPMLDGFSPERKKLHAIWMEYYHWQAIRPMPVGPFEEWAHTREFVTQRNADQSPNIYNTAYLFTRYVKQSTQRPVVVCHGVRLDAPLTGAETERQQLAVIDRVNAACLAADGDGWHYWCWNDDWQSSLAHRSEQKANPTEMYFQGESMGLYDYDDHPRPVVPLINLYSQELLRRTITHSQPKTSEVLLLSSAAKMYNLYRRLAVPLAAAMSGALNRIGVEADYLWSSQNDTHISQETLNSYKAIAIADNMYGRDYRDMPEKLLCYVEQGGTLYFPLDSYDSFADEHGVAFENAALRTLTGVDPDGYRDWPGAKTPIKNWPFPTDKPHEPNFDTDSFPRLHWGICPEFRHRSPLAQYQQLLGFRSADDDYFTPVPGLVQGAEVIAVAKTYGGSLPFIYRHNIGKGTVYVNTWTNVIYRDSAPRMDYGGWEYDFILALVLESAAVTEIDITRGSALWLRNSWGYYWKDM